jgi:mannose-6-phosphate isomerase-like protein (cupin superfamily)
MATSKYSKYIVTELKPPHFIAEMAARYATFATRILWIDTDIVPGAFQMNCSWYLKSNEKSPPSHTHDLNEILGFFGNDPDDPYNLHGEVEFWLGDQKFNINKTAMVFIPSGLKHCPMRLKRVDRPIFHFSVVTSGHWDMNSLKETHKPEADYSKYIVNKLKAPAFRPEFVEQYKKFATRILWMDENVVPGAFQMNTSWYCKPARHAPEPHKHNEDEIIGFFGGDPADPYNLHGEIEMWVGDQPFFLTKSALIFVPAGMKHCPLIIKRVEKPIFHFSVLKGGIYQLSAYR